MRFSRRVSRLVGGDDAAPWQNATMVEAQVGAMGALRADAEHRCVWASGTDALFTRSCLDRATADYSPLPLADLRPRAQLIGGLDWGQTTDRSACVTVGRLPIPGERVFGVACAERWPAGHPPLDVAEQVATSRAHFYALVAETNGLGGPCADRLFALFGRRHPRDGGRVPGGMVVVDEAALARRPPSRHRAPRQTFATKRLRHYTSAETKAAAYSTLRLLLDEGRLVLPAAAGELRRELLLLRVDLSPSGSERIAAEVGHDDLADAFSISTLLYKRPRTAAGTPGSPSCAIRAARCRRPTCRRAPSTGRAWRPRAG